MLQFLFLVALASVPATSLANKFAGLPFNFNNARLGDLAGLCKMFCEDHDYDDFFFRGVESVIQPRIFCGICKKKFSTTSTTSSMTTTTATATTTTTPRPSTASASTATEPTTPPPPPTTTATASTTTTT